MTSRLVDSFGNLVSDMVNDVLLHFETIKIKNKLLDGTYHNQTIGKPVRVIDLMCFVDESGKTALDNIEATSSPITLKRDGNYYTGLIAEPPQWDAILKGKSNLRRYGCKFKLMVNEEGVDV